MANILTNEDICAIGDFGEVVWLECYFDGYTSLQPFMWDIDFTQKPTLVNANNYMYNTYEPWLHDSIIDLFGSQWQDKRYRWWDSEPTDKERKDNEKWTII